MLQEVDLADGQPMFIKIAGREIVVMDAEPFRAMQDKAAVVPALQETIERLRANLLAESKRR